jgi:hypothetical protein
MPNLAADIGKAPNAVWLLDKQQKYTHKYTLAQIENALTTLAEYDMRRKGMAGSTLSYRDILFEMILKIIS